MSKYTTTPYPKNRSGTFAAVLIGGSLIGLCCLVGNGEPESSASFTPISSSIPAGSNLKWEAPVDYARPCRPFPVNQARPPDVIIIAFPVDVVPFHEPAIDWFPDDAR